ncbi:hypothetical protein D9M68_489250 [compost metagenome]
MNEAGAVEEDIDGADVRDERFHRLRIEHVEPVRFDVRFLGKCCKRVEIDIGRMNFRAGLYEGQSRSAADALSCGRNQDDLAFKIRCHSRSLMLCVRRPRYGRRRERPRHAG